MEPDHNMGGSVMIVSPLTGVPIAEGTDFAIDFPDQVDEPRTRLLETFTIPRFADATARDAAATAPVAGQYVALPDALQVYRPEGWATVAGNQIPAATIVYASATLPAGDNMLTGGSATLAQGGVTYDPATGTITVAQSGYYDVNGWVHVTSAASGWQLRVYRDGAATHFGTTIPQQAFDMYDDIAATLFVAAGGTLKLGLTAFSGQADFWAENQMTITLH